jgi:hypothetical protein
MTRPLLRLFDGDVKRTDPAAKYYYGYTRVSFVSRVRLQTFSSIPPEVLKHDVSVNRSTQA